MFILQSFTSIWNLLCIFSLAWNSN